jgi:Fic family protein
MVQCFINHDLVVKAGLAHLWFVTIHPFDDGNGRIARAVMDLLLARSDKSEQRFYSMSAQIRAERKDYYRILEATQKGNLNVTPWITWFLGCLNRAFEAAEQQLSVVQEKTQFWHRHRQVTLSERQRLMVDNLLDGFDGKLTSSKWAKIARCSADTALRDIDDLIAKNILKRDDAGGRSTSYSLVDVNEALSASSARLSSAPRASR